MFSTKMTFRLTTAASQDKSMKKMLSGNGNIADENVNQ